MTDLWYVVLVSGKNYMFADFIFAVSEEVAHEEILSRALGFNPDLYTLIHGLNTRTIYESYSYLTAKFWCEGFKAGNKCRLADANSQDIQGL